jgi:hypothetical protein
LALGISEDNYLVVGHSNHETCLEHVLDIVEGNAIRLESIV